MKVNFISLMVLSLACFFLVFTLKAYAGPEKHSYEEAIEKNKKHPEKLKQGYWRLANPTYNWTFHPWEKRELSKRDIKINKTMMKGSTNIAEQREYFLNIGLSEKDFAVHFWKNPARYLCYHLNSRTNSGQMYVVLSLSFNVEDENNHSLYEKLSWQLWALLAEENSGLDAATFSTKYSEIEECTKQP